MECSNPLNHWSSFCFETPSDMGCLYLSRIVASKPLLGTALQALSRTRTVYTDSHLITLLIKLPSSPSLLSGRRIVSISLDSGPDHLLFIVHPSDHPMRALVKRVYILGLPRFTSVSLALLRLNLPSALLYCSFRLYHPLESSRKLLGA